MAPRRVVPSMVRAALREIGEHAARNRGIAKELSVRSHATATPTAASPLRAGRRSGSGSTRTRRRRRAGWRGRCGGGVGIEDRRMGSGAAGRAEGAAPAGPTKLATASSRASCGFSPFRVASFGAGSGTRRGRDSEEGSHPARWLPFVVPFSCRGGSGRVRPRALAVPSSRNARGEWASGRAGRAGARRPRRGPRPLLRPARRGSRRRGPRGTPEAASAGVEATSARPPPDATSVLR